MPSKRFPRGLAAILMALLMIVTTIAVVGISMVTTNAAVQKAHKSQATTDSKCGFVATRVSNLNVRSGPSTKCAIVSKLTKGSYVILLSKSSGFWHVEYGAGLTGYVSEEYIKVVSEKTGEFSGEYVVNIRNGASVSFKVLSQMAVKNTVCILSTESNGWQKILYDGVKVGYMHGKYISVDSAGQNESGSENNSQARFVYPVSSPNAIGGITPYKASNGRPFFEGHMAIDYNRLTVNANYDIFAIYPGKVIATETSHTIADKSGGYGNKVVLQHQLPDGRVFYSIYGHLEKVYVSLNQEVTSCQVVGKMGNTGNSTGPHLHIGVYTGYSVGPYSSGGTMIDQYKAYRDGRYHYDVREVIRRQDLW